MEEYDKAYLDFTKVLSIYPTEAFYHEMRGDILYCLGNYQEAIKDFLNALNLDTNLKRSNGGLGISYLHSKRYELAEHYLSKAMSLGYKELFIDKYLAYSRYRQGFVDEAISMITKNSKFTKETALGFIKMLDQSFLVPKEVQNNMSAEKYSDAIPLLEAEITLYPNFSILYANLALCFLSISSFDKALLNISKALELDPNDKQNIITRSQILLELERPLEALNELNLVLSNDSENLNALYYRAEAHSSLSDFDKALNDINKIMKLDTGADYMYKKRGECYLNMSMYNDALSDFSKALEIDKTDPDIYFDVGNIYSILGNYEKAIDYYNLTFEVSPNYYWASRVNRNRAYAKYQLGKREEAIQDIRSFEELSYIEAEDILFELKDYLDRF